jgi:hypothetical protein
LQLPLQVIAQHTLLLCWQLLLLLMLSKLPPQVSVQLLLGRQLLLLLPTWRGTACY